jgi:hypothetical protein
VSQWTTFTPDGRRLTVTRQQNGWTVACADNEGTTHELLDVALAKAIRNEQSPSIGGRADYAGWTRHLADQIERSERRTNCERPAARARILPPHGDR